MKDYKRVIGNLISQFNVGSDADRKKAYDRCIEYAREKFKAASDFNLFVSQAAEMLGQVPCRRDVIAESVKSAGDEKLHLAYSPQTGPVLTGNKSGLSYLAGLLSNLASSTKPGEHTHLFAGEFPMCEKTFPLTIYIEENGWFVEADKPVETQQAPAVENPQRKLDAGEVIAFAVLGNLPPTLPVVAGDIYKVLSCEKYKDQNAWIKEIREKSDRLFVFEFISADGATQRFALDLDDPAVLFITRRDVKKLA